MRSQSVRPAVIEFSVFRFQMTGKASLQSYVRDCLAASRATPSPSHATGLNIGLTLAPRRAIGAVHTVEKDRQVTGVDECVCVEVGCVAAGRKRETAAGQAALEDR